MEDSLMMSKVTQQREATVVCRCQTTSDSTNRLLTKFWPIFWCDSLLYNKNLLFQKTILNMKIALKMKKSPGLNNDNNNSNKQPKNIKNLAGGAFRRQGEGARKGSRVRSQRNLEETSKLLTNNQGGRGRAPEKDQGCCKILERNTFRSTNTKKIYKIKQKVYCQSSFIIYLGTCQKCQGQYVGKSTQTFTRRHSGNKQEIKDQIGGLGQHYGGARGCDYENSKMIIVDRSGKWEY